jgi:hypothetical protein
MSLELPQAVDFYFTSITLKGKSPETVLWHRKKLPAFAQFLQQQGHTLQQMLGDSDIERVTRSRAIRLCESTLQGQQAIGGCEQIYGKEWRGLLYDGEMIFLTSTISRLCGN